MTTDATSALRALIDDFEHAVMARCRAYCPADESPRPSRVDRDVIAARKALEAALTADAADGVRVPRYFASGPEGSFFTDDALFAETLLQAADRDRDDWTITDLAAPTAEGTREGFADFIRSSGSEKDAAMLEVADAAIAKQSRTRDGGEGEG